MMLFMKIIVLFNIRFTLTLLNDTVETGFERKANDPTRIVFSD